MHRHITFRVKILVLRYTGIFSPSHRMYCVREGGLNDCCLLLRKHEIFLKFFEVTLSVTCSLFFICWLVYPVGIAETQAVDLKYYSLLRSGCFAVMIWH